MSFGAPLAFWLFALAAPIIGFYLMRARVRRRPVTSLLFWDQLMTQARTSPLWRQLRRWLSLLLQLLLLALIVLALGRPILDWQTEKRRPIALTLDPSISMQATVPGGVSPWENSIQTAKRMVGQMRFFDEMTLILAGSPPEVISPWSRNKRALKDALDQLKPSTVEVDPHDGIRLALNLANRGDTPGKTIVLTDGVWNRPAPEDWATKVEWVWMNDESIQNIGITKFASRRSLRSSEELAIFVEVLSSSQLDKSDSQTSVTSNINPVEIELYRDESLIDVVPVEWNEGDEEDLETSRPWRKEWRFNQPQGAKYEARLAFPESAVDGIEQDNRATFQTESVQTAKIFWVSEPNLFLDAAIQALPQVRFQRVWPPDTIPALIAEQENQQSTEASAELWIFHQATPDPSWNWRPANALFIAPQADGYWGKLKNQEQNGIPTIAEWDTTDPALKNLDLGSIFFRSALNMEPPAEAKILVKSFDAPFIFGEWKQDAPNRWMVWAFELLETDFVFRTAYPSALANLLQTLRPIDSMAIASELPGSLATGLIRNKQLSTKSWTHPQTTPSGEEGQAPGGAETAEANSDVLEGQNTKSSSNVKTPWWSIFPIWWWALVAALVWFVVEWILYTRRVTE